MTNQAKPFSGLKPDPKSLGRDIVAGLVAAVAAIPDGMASAVLAGVNPVAGLHDWRTSATRCANS
ncbi:MAG: hypothetical protein KDI12_13890 [Anaerolineae bacterium]|nr:hypothetical protein [Anaerolineae bacterium]MCO5244560.1 SulP family inorganic anion transporter [Anaerolineae bacterium]HRX01707.1 SulP family inorganic anion transporter [Anaerolineae bacterium]